MISSKNKEVHSKEGSSKSVSEIKESLILSRQNLIKAVEAGPHIIGRKELLKFLKGGKITRNDSIMANCYECMGYYIDGRADCEKYDCPFYPYSPSRLYSRPEYPKQEED